MEITKREILGSISIIAIMVMIGLWISGNISEAQMDQNEIYNKAVKIETTEMFEYGMRTNVGNAFVYGQLEAIDPVSYPDIEGEYMYVEKVTEKYTRHTRTVTKTRTVNGKTETYTDTETYWSWDRIDSEDKKVKQVKFLGVMFNINKFRIPGSTYIDTIKGGYHIRYKYYGVKAKHTGTIFTELKDNTITNKSELHKGMTIDETVEYLQSDGDVLIFWIFMWLPLTGGLVYWFYQNENKWLED
jgi:hypothetical protein